MVSTHLKNISQNGNLPQVGVKIKNIWNHHPENVVDWWNTIEPLLNLVIFGLHLQTRYTTKVTTRTIISHLLVLRFKSSRVPWPTRLGKSDFRLEKWQWLTIMILTNRYVPVFLNMLPSCYQSPSLALNNFTKKSLTQVDHDHQKGWLN